MALTATMYTFDIQLSDVDRGVYESRAVRAACHPSETDAYLWTRVLAYCLEYTDGITLSRGLSTPDEPAVMVRDLTGAITSWIEVGAPDAARLHRTSKATPRVVVYTYRNPRLLQRQYAGARIHRAQDIVIRAVERGLLDALGARLDRRVVMDVSVTEGILYVTIGGEVLSGEVTSHPVVAA